MHCFFIKRGVVGWIIFVVIVVVERLGFERTQKWFVIDIRYLKMRKAECWSENDIIRE